MRDELLYVHGNRVSKRLVKLVTLDLTLHIVQHATLLWQLTSL